MGTNQDVLTGTEILKLNPVDIDHLFRRSGLIGNSLSPFSYNAEQAATSNPSELFKQLAESAQFKSIAQRLLEPDLKIQFNSGGAGAVKDQYYALLSDDDKSVLVQMTNSEGQILLLLFTDLDSFLNWWTVVYASAGMGSYQTVFPSVMEAEVLVCALHSVDIYRRAYMESMLEYRSGVDLSLTVQEFVQLLKRSLASGDQRWLLPAMFEITPGLKNSSISLNPDHLKQIEQLGFISTKENIITLGERARIIGTEFITSWLGAFGWQASALINGQERILSRVFLAPTAFANHLISFESGESGKYRFRHQASTRDDLINTLIEWLNALQKATGSGDAVSKNVKSGAPKFCGQCGAEIRPGKKFCTSCGTAI